MAAKSRASWLVYALGALCVAAIAIAFLVVGPASRSASAESRVVTAQRGVVQSTVSGSGNVAAASELDLGFETSGVVEHIYVRAGEHVVAGQLLAALDPEDAEVSLEQARAALQGAEATLAQDEEDESESETSGADSGGSSTGHEAEAGAGKGTGTGTGTAPASDTQQKQESQATREANLASARASVRSERLAVQSAEEAVQNTRLYAPSTGTIVTLEGEVGQTVSASGTSKASASSSSSSGSGSGSGARNQGESSPSSSSGDSSEPFAVLSDLGSMQLVVALSESEVVHVHPGQAATVTIEALEGKKLAAHVTSVATLAASSSSGVVSYDVTFHLDQLTPGLKPGMSASAEVVVEQAEGVNVPSSAISAGTVTVVRGSKRTVRSVVTGLAGNTTTIIRSGLKAGEQVALPLATSTTSSSGASLLSRLSRRGGSGALSGAGGLGAAGGLAIGGGASVSAAPGGPPGRGGE
ncbi:MAG TPA: biotin/lipoyl-binding protein [Solirubrobacteraceae bacterium]|jgi:multidrug efflux pump subunit AcrA (membrane-fusion protein)